MPKRSSLRKKNRHLFLIGIVIVGVLLAVGVYEVIPAGPPYACITGESYIHIHPYLRISILGQNVTIPSSVGSFQSGSCLMPIHMHDASGIIHLELSAADASSGRTYTLGDFFKVWAATPNLVPLSVGGSSRPITFSATEILGYSSDSSHKVVVLVDGKQVSDPVNIDLEKLDYCSAALAGLPPCSPTAGSNPLWNGSSNYPYGTGHTIVVEYVSS